MSPHLWLLVWYARARELHMAEAVAEIRRLARALAAVAILAAVLAGCSSTRDEPPARADEGIPLQAMVQADYWD